MKKIGEFKVSSRVSVRVYRQPGDFGMLGGKYVIRIYHGKGWRTAEARYAATEAGALRVAEGIAERLRRDEGSSNPARRSHRSRRSRRANPSKRTNYDKLVPKGQIDFLVGRIHVGTPDSEVEADIRERSEKAKMSEPQIRANIKYALARHRANRGMYVAVMSGNIGRGRANPSRKTPQTRWKCGRCGAEGWWTPSTHIGQTPLKDHDRPDGRRCLAGRSSRRSRRSSRR
jgi:hypothetical protein